MKYSLYWIKDESHTCLLTEGYIGITKNSVAVRFNQHKSAARKFLKQGRHLSALKQALTSNTVVCQELVVGSEDYIRELERTLRPSKHIGWNACTGGGFNPYEIRCFNYTSYHYDRFMKYLEENGHPMSKKEPWEIYAVTSNPLALSIWSVADYIYKNREHSASTISRQFLLLKGRSTTVRSILKKIADGWNPVEDSKWVDFMETHMEQRKFLLMESDFGETDEEEAHHIL